MNRDLVSWTCTTPLDPCMRVRQTRHTHIEVLGLIQVHRSLLSCYMSSRGGYRSAMLDPCSPCAHSDVNHIKHDGD